MVDIRYKTTLEKINLIKPEQVYFGTKNVFRQQRYKLKLEMEIDKAGFQGWD